MRIFYHKPHEHHEPPVRFLNLIPKKNMSANIDSLGLKRRIRTTSSCWLVLFVVNFFFLVSCEDPSSSQNIPRDLPEGYGSFSLRIAENENNRTILPTAPSLDDYAVYTLDFTATSGGLNTSLDRGNATLATEPIVLAAGTYTLTVNAYLDTGKEHLAAQGTLANISITAGANASAVVQLKALTNSGAGIFNWSVNITAGGVTSAAMTISQGAETKETVTLNNTGTTSGNPSLPSGVYNVSFHLVKNGGTKEECIWNELLYIYSSLTSNFTKTFNDEYFYLTHYNVTFNHNYDSISVQQSVLHGDTLASNTPERNGFNFLGWYTDESLSAPYNFDTEILNDFTLYAYWEVATTVTVNDGTTITDHADLVAAFAEIGTRTGQFTVTLYEDQIFDTAVRNISASQSITILGSGAMRTISHNPLMGAAVNMFTIDANNANLTLGNNIKIQGRPDPGAGYIVLIRNGTFTMQDGSIITGHNSTIAGTIYLSQSTARFIMTGGEITANNNNGTDSDRTGGIYISNGNLTMSGGKIYGNTQNGTIPSDVLAANSSGNQDRVILSGSAEIASLRLYFHNLYFYNNLTIGGPWQGKVDALYLTNTELWVGKTVVNGTSAHTLTTEDMDKIGFAYFFVFGNVNAGLISDSFIIVKEGADIGKLLGINAVQPTINTQPSILQGRVYMLGDPDLSTPQLTIAAQSNDSGALSYQWFINTVNSNEGGTAIDGETNPAFSPVISTAGTFWYYCVVTNTNNTVPGNTMAERASNVVTVNMLDEFPAAIVENINTGEKTAYNNGVTAISNANRTGNFRVSLNENISLQGVSLATDAKITLVGIGGEREIRNTEVAANRVTMFTISNTGTVLTLGNNITLHGRSDSNSGSCAAVNSNGTLIMEAGSKITGQKDIDGFFGAVTVNGTNARFIMNGGIITGNTHLNSISGAGGVCLSNGFFEMNGGEISGNTSFDVQITTTSANRFIMSGNAVIGKLILYATGTGAAQGASLSIGASWNGSIETLNLQGNNELLGTARSYWTDSTRTIFNGINSAQAAKIGLGRFLTTSTNWQTISDTHYINASGVLTVLPDAAVVVNGNPFDNLTDALASTTEAGTYVIEVFMNQNLAPRSLSGSGRNITITSPTGAEVQLSSNGRLFTVSGGVTLTLGAGITLRGITNNNGPLITNSGGTLIIDGAVITGNLSISGDGGGVMNNYNGTTTLKSGTISFNTASGGGGGMTVDGGSFTMEGGIITDNSTNAEGGGICGFNGPTIIMSGGLIHRNTARSDSGGVYMNGGTFTKTGNSIITGWGDDQVNGNVVKNAAGTVVTAASHAVSVIGIKRPNTVGAGVNLP